MQECRSSRSQLHRYQVKKLEGPVECAAATVSTDVAAADSTPTEGLPPNPPHADPPVQPDGPGPPPTVTLLQLGSTHIKNRTLIRLEGTLAGQPAIGLLDSGASGNFVSSSFIRDHGLTTDAVEDDRIRVTLADGSQQDARGVLKDANLVIDTYQDRISYVALPLSGYDFILGMPSASVTRIRSSSTASVVSP